MVVFRHQLHERFWCFIADVRALQPAGHKVQPFVFQQLANDDLRLMTRQFAVENLFAVIEDQRAVFRDEGDLIFQLREEGDELVILVAAGDNKFNVAGFKLLKLCPEAVTIVLLGIIKESSVHIGDDNFYGHTVLWVTAFETF